MPTIFLAMFLFVTVNEFCSQESDSQSCAGMRRDQLASKNGVVS
jgi:hypothetical protein